MRKILTLPAPSPLGSLRDLVEGVERLGVPEGEAGGGFHAGSLEVMDVAADEAIDDEADGFSVRGDGGGFDDGSGLIHLGGAVAFLQDVSPCLHGVGGGIGGGGGVNRLGEGEVEAIGLGAHGEDLERGFAGPFHAVEVEGLVATGGPAAVRPADEEDAAVIELGGNDAALESFEEMEGRALIDAVDLFEENTLHLRVGLLADVNLPGPGAEFSAAEVGDDGGGGLADFAVWEDDGGRDVVREFQALCEDAGAADGLGWGG